MKLKVISTPILWLLSAWLVVTLPVDAFYDPNLGRWIHRDPVGESAGSNLYGFDSNDCVNRVDPVGLATAGAAPVFPGPNDKRWNRSNNCYGYACNRPDGPQQPGRKGTGKDCADKSCDGLKKAAMSDGLTEPDQATGECPPGTHKVAYGSGTDANGKPDYHWYRQDAGGDWSHKLGWTGKPQDTDAAGNRISDPTKANHDYRKQGGGNYQLCPGFLCAPN